MQTFTQKQNRPQLPVSSKTYSSSHHPYPILHLLRKIGNQAVQRLLHVNTEGLTDAVFSVLPEDDDVEYATQEPSGDTGAGDGGAPLQSSNSADEGSYCAPTMAKFINIPSGSLTPSLQNGIFGAPFHMDAQFAVNTPCSCKRGEYRQFIRGAIKRNGTPMKHNLCANLLHPTTWNEDCYTGSKGDEKYGYRSMPSRHSKFISPDQITGCIFNGFDWPGFRLNKFKSGDVLEQDTEFEGRLVNARESDKTLATSTWSLKGSITVP